MPLPSRMPAKAAQHKSGDYGLVQKFPGYHAREDKTTLPIGTLISPSQNVVINTSGRVAHVRGYTLDGVSSSVPDSGILSNYDFTCFTGAIRNLRAGFMTTAGDDGKLQYRYIDASNAVNWVNLMTQLSTIRLSFTTFYDSTNLVPTVKWVDGTSNIYSWNGAVTTFASASSGTGYLSTLNATPTAGGTGYLVGDILTVSGGTATAKVTAVTGADSGAITSATGLAGINYVVGDILTLGGGGATVQVVSVRTEGLTVGIPQEVRILTSGSGYSVSYYMPSGGSGTGAVVSVGSVGGQVITAVQLLTTSTGYTTGAGKVTTGGTGTGATLNITAVGNYSMTKQGTNTWIQDGFQATSGSITINEAPFTYSAAFGDKLIGFAVDPTTPAFTVGTIIHQTPTTTPFASMTETGSNLKNFSATVIGCGRRNQIYLGSSSSNSLYISKVNSYTDYSYSSPALDGDGAFWTLTSPSIAFVNQESRNDTNEHDLYIAHGNSTWSETYFSTYTTADSTGLRSLTQVLNVTPLKTAYLQAPANERMVTKMKNHIVFVGKDNVANFLGYISYNFVPETVDFSYPIIDDMNSYDFTDGSVFYYKNYIYIAIPKEGLIRVYNMTDQTKQQTSSIRAMEDVDVSGENYFWEAPITYPLSGFYYTVDKGLCGHSYTTSESYQLFTGGSLNNQQIDCNATFSYDDKGDRTQSKSSNEIWVEGYIAQNTQLNVTVSGDLDAFTTSQTRVIDGGDNTIVAFGGGGHSLGEKSLGSSPLGGSEALSASLPAWFHVAKTYTQVPSYLESVSFATKGVDLQWELITYGTNSTQTSEGNNAITQ